MINMYTFRDGRLLSGVDVKGPSTFPFLQIGTAKKKSGVRIDFNTKNSPQVLDKKLYLARFDRTNKENPTVLSYTGSEPLPYVLINLDLRTRNSGFRDRPGTWCDHKDMTAAAIEIGAGCHEIRTPHAQPVKQNEYLLAVMNGSRIIVRPSGITAGDKNSQFVISCTRTEKGLLELAMHPLGEEFKDRPANQSRERVPMSAQL